MSNTVCVEASCIICEHSYNSAVNRPLVLPCSHSFCQDCLKKLEAAGKTRCPVCRKTFKKVRVSDLPTCYQLIPTEGQAVKNKIKDCQEHDEDYIFWCTSCAIPACKKCWKLKHAGCDFLLIEEKYEAIEKDYMEIKSLLIDAKCADLPKYLLENKMHLTFVRNFIGKLQILENELMQYQKTLDDWEKRAEGILSCVPKVVSPLSFLEISQKTSEVKTLTQELQARPNSLLLQIACSYNGTADDADAFVANIKSRYGGQQTCGKLNLKLIGNKVLEETAAPDLKDEEVWTISDLVSAVAVNKKILTSSSSPSKLRVTWSNWSEDVFGNFFDVGRESGAGKMCPADFDLDCFLCFEKQSRETLALTSSLVDKTARWFYITQFCGHLNAAAVKMLPSTIKCVGLVLRDQEDMAAVNALCGAAFRTSYQEWIKDRLLWRNWTELNLSFAKSFRPNSWNVTWKLELKKRGGRMPIKMTKALHYFGVRLRLHLPQLLPGDLLWLKDLLSTMNLDPSLTEAMCLHSTSVDPDPLLGVLRDRGQRWEVHLPASLPKLVPREQVTAQYKKYGHSVIWDLE